MGSLFCVDRGCRCVSVRASCQQNNSANGVLLYQGMSNAGYGAHIVATSDWPIATVAQESGVCQWIKLQARVLPGHHSLRLRKECHQATRRHWWPDREK